MKKVLIVGASGQVGSALFDVLKDSFNLEGTYLNQKKDNFIHLDITNSEEVAATIGSHKPDIVILTAALTHVDYCETHQDEAFRINVNGTRHVADACISNNSKLVYLSTDYVFDGRNGPYTEEAVPNPINYYGKTKLEAENIVRKLTDYLVVRTTGVFDFGYDQKNFVVRLINNLTSSKEVKVPDDQFANPTLATFLASCIKMLLEKDSRGIYNVAGGEYLSRYSFAIKVANFFGLDTNLIIPMKTSLLKQEAKRPLKGGLVLDKIKHELNVTPPTVVESLEMRSAYAKRQD